MKNQFTRETVQQSLEKDKSPYARTRPEMTKFLDSLTLDFFESLQKNIRAANFDEMRKESDSQLPDVDLAAKAAVASAIVGLCFGLTEKTEQEEEAITKISTELISAVINIMSFQNKSSDNDSDSDKSSSPVH